MKYASFFLIGFFFFTIFAPPAQAKRFRFFAIPGFGGGETIELVYDLPNEAPFIKEGQPFDVGYLKSRKGNAYVLYHGDRYIKLEDREIALLTAMLGFDPTAQHRAQHAPREMEAQGSSPVQAATRHPKPDATDGGTPLWVTLAPLIALVAIFFVLVRKGLRGIARFARLLTGGASGRDKSMEAAYASLDARVAERLSQLQPEIAPQTQVAQVQVEQAYVPQTRGLQAHDGRGGHFAAVPLTRMGAPVRTFGRRGV